MLQYVESVMVWSILIALVWGVSWSAYMAVSATFQLAAVLAGWAARAWRQRRGAG